MSTASLPPEVMVALEKMIEKMNKGTPGLPPGVYIIKDQLVIELDCTIQKDNDESYVPTISIPLKSVLALMLQKSGTMKDYISSLIKDCMIQAVTLGPSLKDLLEAETKEIDTYMDEVNSICRAGGHAIRTGKTFVRGSIQVNKGAISTRKVV